MIADAYADRAGRLARFAAVAGLSLALVACEASSAKDANNAASTPPVPIGRPVLVVRAAYAPSQSERDFVGTIRPRVETDLGFRVAGKVAARLVNVGDVVRAGQALAILDETDFGLQVEQAEAELRAAEASMRQAEGDMRRTDALTGRGYAAVSAQDRQRAVVEEARGRQLRAERAVTLAVNARSYAVLKADGDGVITGTSIEPGQVVNAGQAAIMLARTGEREAQVAIPETLIARARTAHASVTLWSRPGQRYEARLRELAPAADPATRTYQARFSLPSADEAVQLGMTATVTLGAERAEPVARLPLSALFNQGQGPSVWVVAAEGRPVLKPVTVAGYEANEVLVTSGVEPGDQVVTLGVSKLDPGQRLRVVDALRF